MYVLETHEQPIDLVRVLVTFYCGKLEDTETIVPALKGLVTLVGAPGLTSTDAVEVVKAYVSIVSAMQNCQPHALLQGFFDM